MIPPALVLGALGAAFWIVAARRAVRVTGVVLCWIAATALVAELVGDVATPVVVSVLAAPLVLWRRELLSRPWLPLHAAGGVLLVLSLPTLLVRDPLANSGPHVGVPVTLYVSGSGTGWTGSLAYESTLEVSTQRAVTASDALVIATAVAVALAAWAWWRRSTVVFATAGAFLITAVHGGLEPPVRLGWFDQGSPVLPSVPGLVTPSLVLLAGAVVALVRSRRDSAHVPR